MVNATSKEVVPVENDCHTDEPTVLCIVKDATTVDWKNSRHTVNLPASTLVKELYCHVAKQVNYVEDTFDLVWSKSLEDGTEEIVLNGEKTKTLQEIGLAANGKKNNFLIKDKDGVQPKKAKDETDETITESVSNLFQSNTSSSYYSSSDGYTLGKSETGFVGLVNQAMTCYLNSLLQTLFMTPEFRNAIYRWDFTGSEEEASKSIPYQLQKLFLHLQTSSKRAVETTDVTKSFGWDSSEAWQQHDVQELCRVMFDALESKFKKTDQDDIINQLYQGKLKDYVKCQQCGHESARTDTYLDIPLAIRPFGSKHGLGSVENALEDFVTPELLEGTNQYFCEKCDKKCDAHKGLKFFTFPYLLTFQLKRFAFDHATLHRVKLNDRMTFPKYLDLKDIVSKELEENGANEDASLKGDSPSSTETDSGVSEGCSDNGMSTGDEDMDNANTGINRVDGTTGMKKVELTEDLLNSGLAQNMKGPYWYELFSIMIHSGSASGGHYYAYIKSFTNGQWYCFNDQSVSRVYDDDIERTYGGLESSRSYYSSVYSSSTNAYMLMYRQVSPERNAKFLDQCDVPTHIVDLMYKLRHQEEMERRRKEMDRSLCKIKIFCEHPVSKRMMERKLEIHKDDTLKAAISIAHKLFHLEKVLTAEQCRIVKYDDYYDYIERSFDGEEQNSMSKVLCGVKQSYIFDLLLETRMPHERFLPYKPGGTTVKVHIVDLENERVASYVNVRPLLSSTVKDLHTLIHEKFKLPLDCMRIVFEGAYNDLKLLDSPNKVLKELGFFKNNRVFVEASNREAEFLFKDSRMFKILDVYQHTIQLCVMLPDPSRKPSEHTSRYICEAAVDSEKTEKQREKIVPVDKRITLGKLKEILKSDVGCLPEFFRVYRVYSNNQEIEYSKLTDPLTSFNDDSKVRVKYSRALKKGEHQLKIFLLKPIEKEPFKYFCDWIVTDGMTVKQCKELLQPEICQRCGIDVPVENLRMRRKNWKNPGTVYVDSQVFEENIQVYASFEVFLEILEGPERMTSTDQLSIYVRHWHPSTITLDLPKEVVLQDSVVEELKDEISKLSSIPVENLELCKGRGQFPCEVPILEIHDEYDWSSDMTSLGASPLLVNDDGAVLFYRDKTEKLMEITEEKKKEIMKKENAKTNSSSMRTGRFSYKEKALKIYTDDDRPSK
ncbi:Ubiquitin carboxyl-terminal hydrolase 47 [Desmophyllum pertusum]|uniref:Ubiquitin carboxyl-terminal hydrolase 47 n=1 Tax=Desmophyllum pertusum TaxID=174260 RepID=A0A9W9ZPG4_9CNID|nr:Ubiquitin carboxyl-terminal hydrolase 47 [Desmophyllum pertusum]